MTKRKVDVIGEYFPLNFSSVQKLIESGGGIEELLCFIVLCRGAGAAEETGWSRNSIANYLCISPEKASKIFSWLTDQGFIKPIAPVRSEKVIPDAWQILDKESDVFLPNSLVGKKKSSIGPLGKLYHNPGSMYFPGVNTNRVKLIQLMLLIFLYRHYDLEEYGGVKPNTWTREWHVRAEVEKLPLITGGTVLAVKGNKPVPQPELLEWLSIGNILPSNADAHVEYALKNLKDNNLLYETIYVWEADPTLEKPMIVYAHYHIQDWARVLQPCWAAKNLTTFFRDTLASEDLERFRTDGKLHNGKKKHLTILSYDEQYHVRSALVLCHLPRTVNHKTGRDSLFNRTLRFTDHLRSITVPQDEDESSDDSGFDWP